MEDETVAVMLRIRLSSADDNREGRKRGRAEERSRKQQDKDSELDYSRNRHQVVTTRDNRAVRKIGKAEERNMEKTESRKTAIKHFRDLEVYRKSFELAMKIYQATKKLPAEEKYALTDQIRRSSRAVCSNLAEAWRKRKYPAVFCNKLTDAMQEASETQSWLEFCHACHYMDETLFTSLDKEYEAIIGMLNRMEQQADKFCY